MKKNIILFLALTLGKTIWNNVYAQNEKLGSGLPESARLLSDFIQYRSLTGSENAAGEYLTSICHERSLHVDVLSDEIGSYNFTASLYPLTSGKPNIILLNHLDVVPANDSACWKYPPFDGTIADGKVWGRGAIDSKGLAIMQVLAICRLKPLADYIDLPYNVTVLCVSEEEGSSKKGASLVVTKYLDRLSPIVVFGEGGAGMNWTSSRDRERVMFGISTCEKQALWLTLKIAIQSEAHGAAPPSQYANKEMIDGLSELLKAKQPMEISDVNMGLLKSIGHLEKGVKGFVLRHIRLFKPFLTKSLRASESVSPLLSNTITLTQLTNPPGVANQIGQEITASLDCRLLPGTDPDKFIKQIRKVFSSTEVSIEVDLLTINAGPSSIENIFFQKFSQSIADVYPNAMVVPYLFPAYSDNSFFRSKGIPAYGIMPLILSSRELQSIHNVDEHILIQSLENGIAVYTTFLNKVLLPTSSVATNSSFNNK